MPFSAQRTLMMGAVGAGAGILLSFFSVSKSEQSNNKPEELANLRRLPDAFDALQRLHDYRVLEPKAYDFIANTLDRLMGLFLLVNSKNHVLPSTDYKAHRYKCNIEEALGVIRTRFNRGVPPKEFTDDAANLLKVVSNYVYNIRMQLNEKIAQGDIKVTT